MTPYVAAAREQQLETVLLDLSSERDALVAALERQQVPPTLLVCPLIPTPKPQTLNHGPWTLDETSRGVG